MKNYLIMVLLFVPIISQGYNWTLYGPSGLHVNNILFGAGNGTLDVICTNEGIVLNDGAGYSWNTYNNGSLPAVEAIGLDSDNILVVMGNGSYSDGIFKFNLTSKNFTLLSWLHIPCFIRQNQFNNKFYAGGRYGSLFVSSDGVNWDTIPYFNSRGCADIDFYYNNITVIQENNVYATYYSTDGGLNWTQSLSNIPIHKIKYKQGGKLWGIFTGFSNSSGVYYSDDLGATWDLSVYADNINTFCFDVVGDILTGWHGTGVNQGVAIYDTTSNDFDFVNWGLQNLNINSFSINPILSSITIFACTDSGVFFSNDYLSGIELNTVNQRNYATVYPNPVNSDSYIISNIQSEATLTIYNSSGVLVTEQAIKEGKFRLLSAGFETGVYIYRILSSGNSVYGRFVVE